VTESRSEKKSHHPLSLPLSHTHTLSLSNVSASVRMLPLLQLHSHLLCISKKLQNFFFFEPGNREHVNNCFTFHYVDVHTWYQTTSTKGRQDYIKIFPIKCLLTCLVKSRIWSSNRGSTSDFWSVSELKFLLSWLTNTLWFRWRKYQEGLQKY